LIHAQQPQNLVRLEPKAIGRTAPGSATTSYNSLTLPSSRRQWPVSPLLRSMICKP